MDYNSLYKKSNFENFQLEIENNIQKGLISKSIFILLECIKYCPDHPGIYYLISKTYFHNEEYNKSLNYINQALYYNAEDDEYLGLAAIINYYLQNYDKAKEYATKANIKNGNNIQALITLAILNFTETRYNEAVKYINEILRIDSNNFDALRLLTKCYIIQNHNVDETLKLLKKVNKIKPDDKIDIDIIKLLYMNDLYQECEKECKKILLKKPNSLAAQKARELIDKIRQNNRVDESITETSESTKNKKNNVKRQTQSLEEALQRLNSLIGLDEVKREVDKIIKLIQFEKNRARRLGIENCENNQSYHFMFLGNPGTGKTTVARLLGDIFYYLGILEKGHMVECDRSTLVGEFIGQTAQLTKKAIEEAIGGVLFIDEAYALAREGASSNDFGKEAIDTLIKAMEDRRGQFIVILAGYTKEMRELMKVNPGLQSRINLNIEFVDYTDQQLLEIAVQMCSNNKYHLTRDGEKAFTEKINKYKVDDSFANARTARNLIEDAIREKAFRIGNKHVPIDELSNLEPIDFGLELCQDPMKNIEDLFNELNSMVGLTQVKEMINEIIRYIQFQNKRKEDGYQFEEISLNMIFVGNPGTGKTTVARIVSELFKEMGILKKGHLVEAGREDLVSGYLGQTASKTLEKVKEAYGGILFIDEAYALNSGGEQDFGKEAIATLIKEMEDNRDKLAVIMAGYTKEMKDLLNLNPGITSRIGNTIEFPDYNPDELFEIFIRLCNKNGYILTEGAKDSMYRILEYRYQQRDKNFGNARMVRQYFEQLKKKQAMRAMSNSLEGEEMLTIIREDIEQLSVM